MTETSANISIAEPAAGAETVKITLDRKVSPGGSVYFESRVEAEGWPLVEKLFAVEGVLAVLARENVLIVSRRPGAPWPALLDGVKRTIQDHYASDPDADEKIEVPGSGADDAGLRRRVEEVLDHEINPMVAMHGGHITLLDVQGTRVFIQMAGGCQGCGMASVTLKQGVEQAIRQRVPEVTEILDTTDHASGTNPYYSPSTA